MNEVELQRLIVRMMGEDSNFQAMTHRVESSSRSMADSLQISSRRIEVMGLRLRGFGVNAASALVPLIGIVGGIGMAFKSVSLAAELEKNEIAFGTMLRNAELGKQMVADLAKFAAETPLNTADVQAATRTLLQFGVSGNKIIPTLKMLGDVVGGDAEKFKGIALAFGQMTGAGRATNEEINQMIERGFNPLTVLAEKSGKTVGFWKDEVSKGKVSLEQINEAFRIATSEGGAYFDQMKKQSQSLSGLFSTMQDDIDASLRIIGKDLAEVLGLKDMMKLISEIAQASAAWLKGLSSGTKTAIASIAAATVAIGVLIGVTLVLGKAVAYATGGLSILGFVIASGAALAVGGLASVIVSLGGITGTLAYLRTRAEEAWEWLKPVRQALGQLWETVQVLGTRAWNEVKRVVQETWESMTGGIDVDWEGLRDDAVTAILAVEFSLLNMRRTWDLVWTFVQYKAVQTFEILRHGLMEGVPAALRWLKDNWAAVMLAFPVMTAASILIVTKHMYTGFRAVFAWMLDAFKAVFEAVGNMMFKLVDNVVRVFSSIKDIVTGKVSLADLWMKLSEEAETLIPKLQLDLERGLNLEFTKFPDLPERQMGDLEQKLKLEFEQLRGSFVGDFEQFRQQRLAQFAGNVIPEEEQKRLEYAGEKAAGAMNKGLKNELGKMDATIAQSAEAVSRLEKFKDRMDMRNKANASPMAIKPAASNVGSAEAKGKEEEYLKRIAQNTDKKNQAPPVVLAPANF